MGPPRHRGDRLLPQGPALRGARRDRRRPRDARRAGTGRGRLTIDPLAIVLGVAGGALGLAADRFATRWPEHDEEHPPGRRIDWRTILCGTVGAVAFGLLPARFAGDTLALIAFGAWFVTLVVGLATDLDQRVLPDELTLPVIPLALLYAFSGMNPLVGGAVVLAIAAAVLIPAILYLPSIPFGAGAFGWGDVKFLAGMGLMVGGDRALSGTLFGLILSGVVLLVLLVTRRVGLKTFVPLGPFLIIGALWAVLIRA
jgi:leader peptidase (prepilin peptidase)/N-methyltransferase